MHSILIEVVMFKFVSAVFAAALLVSSVSCGPPTTPIPGASAARSSIEGRVTRIERAPEDDLQQNVRITVAVDDGSELDIDLAPGWVLDEQGLRLEKEDAVAIEARSVAGGLEATSIRSSGPRIDLRAQDGKPLWHPKK
ncbi:MAG: hypothetical protein AB7K71_02835 [Polyangiaceae bacterium]